MQNQILNKLKEIEFQHDVEILFAIESGSRAWGFASPDSDFDIRFVYKRKLDDYLGLWKKKDTIEFMTEDDLDGSGWDLQKASRLLAKSNASFLGWLFSPMVYIENGETLNNMRKLAAENFNPVAAFHHYHNMNKGFLELLDDKNLKIKPFFYSARTALCANWILKFNTVPPVEFIQLYPLLDNEIQQELNKLIMLKASTKELGKVEIKNSVINYIKTIAIENNELKEVLKSKKPNYNDFDLFFKDELK